MEFLKAVTAAEALRLIEAHPVSLTTETVSIEDGEGRILARDIVSGEDIPPFPRSLVDGYALRAKDTYGARETGPALLTVKGEVRVGEETDIAVEEGSSVYLSTGAMVPEGADSAVMQEFVRRAGDVIEVTKGVFKGENVCFRGEDIEKGAVALREGTRLTALHMGILAALGVSGLTVFRKARVGLISSGDEIVSVDATLSPGKIRDINRYTLSGLVRKAGALATFAGIAADSMADVTSMLRASEGSDMILVSGGSSKGARDLVAAAIEDLGGEILFHGINIKPGKPILFGRLRGTPVFGLPGHPASCVLAFVRFVLPLLARMTGEKGFGLRKVVARLTTNAPSSYGIEEYVRVRVELVPGGFLATPVFSKSAVISSLSAASGYVVVPAGREGLEADEEMEVFLFD